MDYRFRFLFKLFFLFSISKPNDHFDRLKYFRENLIDENLMTSNFSITPSIDRFISEDSTLNFYLNSSFLIHENYPKNKFSFFLSASTIKNLSVVIEPIIISSYYGLNELGTNYNRGGFSGKFENSFIRYKTKNFMINYGRSSISWGRSLDHSIIQSANQPSYDHFFMRMIFKNISLDILNGQLSSEYLVNDKRIRRNISGHRLNLIFNDNFALTIGEQILYTGINRPLELFYSNPFMPYFLAGLEGEEEIFESDNDNSIIFAEFNYCYKKYLNLHGELIIDDIQVDNTGLDDAVGFSIGFSGKEIFLEKPMYYRIQFTDISSLTYIHHGQFTTWQNRGHSVGYTYGPDSKSMNFNISYYLDEKLNFELDYTFLEKGDNNLSSIWNSEIYNIKKKKYNFTSFSITKKISNICFELGYYLKLPSNEIAFGLPLSNDEGSYFFKVTTELGKQYKFK